MAASRFDRLVLATLAALALGTALVAWRGDQVGARVAAMAPAGGATGVSTRTLVRVTFAQEMDSSAAPAEALVIRPAVAGVTNWEGNSLVFRPAAALQPETTYEVTLQPALRSRLGRPLLRPLTWHFRTGGFRLVHLSWDEQGREQLFVVDPDGSNPRRLTQEPEGVWEYAVSPDGATIAFTALRPDGGTDLWAVPAAGGEPYLLLACQEAACGGPNWAPDGRRLVYERRDLSPLGGPPGSPRLWLLDAPTGETIRLFQDSQMLGMGARWAPTGEWLSYVSPMDRGVQVYNVRDGRSFVVYSSMGEPGIWSAAGDFLLVTAIEAQGDRFAIKLLRLEMAAAGGVSTDLSGDLDVEDGAPEVSPDGQWVAFTRKVARAAVGKQVWLMRPDGREARPLTNEPEVYHGPPRWSPDGRFLVFQRYLITAPERPPGVWLLEVATGELRPVAAEGSQPAWLP